MNYVEREREREDSPVAKADLCVTFLTSFFRFTFMCVYIFVCVQCVTVHTCTSCHPQRPAEGVRSPGAGVTAACELPCGCWEANFGSLQERPVLSPAGHLSRPLITLAFCLSLPFMIPELTCLLFI